MKETMTKHGKEIDLGQITDMDIDSWSGKYEYRENDGYYCPKCGSRILQVTCHVSIHLKIFEPQHAGPGRVVPLNYPTCPKCDGDIYLVRACYHVEFEGFQALGQGARA
jgi:hypothetical protein